MEIPAPLRDRQAVRRRRAHAREPRAEKRREADTALPVSRWNLISAPLSGVSCRQKTAEQNYYNRFSRMETVPSWFRCWCCNAPVGTAAAGRPPREARQPARGDIPYRRGSPQLIAQQKTKPSESLSASNANFKTPDMLYGTHVRFLLEAPS